ncbi:hypothetical protein AB0M97_26690 [Streptomyces sp. NPDC051207]|uniref:hypothetical protein n=1 Tax=Streptomyces sp. NPDC051207 TaxID=3154641 RepID=UPI00343F2D6A
MLIDATLVRTILVRASMCLLGRANWWAPAMLQHNVPMGTSQWPFSFRTSCEVFAGQACSSGFLGSLGLFAGRDVVEVADAVDAGGSGNAAEGRSRAGAASLRLSWNGCGWLWRMRKSCTGAG